LQIFLALILQTPVKKAILKMNFPKSDSSGEEDVASILAALSVMKSEMTPLTVSKVLDASKSLEKQLFRDQHYVTFMLFKKQTLR
jgi:hypothetical protein